MPCTMRAMHEMRRASCDSAQPIEPSMNTTIAARNTRARAEAVGGPAADRNEDREREQIGGDRELQRQRAGADVGGDRRQRGRDHRRVHVLHEQGDRDDQRHDAFAGMGMAGLESLGRTVRFRRSMEFARGRTTFGANGLCAEAPDRPTQQPALRSGGGHCLPERNAHMAGARLRSTADDLHPRDPPAAARAAAERAAVLGASSTWS